MLDVVQLLVDTEPHSAALNMAIDEVLLDDAEKPLLRAYRWERAAVSFGYFGCFAEVADRFPRHDTVRRWTGGGIVEHGEDFTYSLVLPGKRQAGEIYGEVHRALAGVLREFGVDAVAVENSAPKISGACFENPVRHDVVADGRKVAGAAQRRTCRGLLQQGSVQRISLPDIFAERFAGAVAGRVEQGAIDSARMGAARELAARKYGGRDWLRMR